MGVAGISINYGTGSNSQITITVNEIINELLGDYNEDGIVDGGDYTVWRDNMDNPSFNLPNEGATEGTVTEEDFAIWRAHFGETLPPGSGSGAASQAAVPEPSSFLLASVALAFAATLATRRCNAR